MPPKKSVTKGRFKRKGAGRPKIKVTKTFKKNVKAIINEELEDKQSYLNVSDVNYNSGISATGDAVPLVPNMSKSVNDNGRIGESITLKSFNVKGHMLINITSPTYSNSRICIRLMVVQPKMYLSAGAVNANFATWSATLLRKGGTTGAFTGAVSDLYAPINTSNFITYYDKKYYMAAPYAPISQSGNQITDPGTICKFFNINFKVKNKKVKFDDSIDSGVTPVNYNPVLLLGYSKLDSAAPDTLSTAINLSWTSLMTYQDA